jgi:ferrous-iron efflux pump FieF
MATVQPHPDHHQSYAFLAMYWTLATVFILLAIKAYAYFHSGSMAVLATLIDTLGDGAISLITFISVKVSLKPADEEHRFGHGKIEGFSALFQSGVLFAAGMFLAFEAIHRLLSPRPIADEMLGITVAAITIILTLILTAVQSYALKRAPSLAIEADHKNYTGDVFLNGGVILTLLISMNEGPVWVDTVFGLLIAAYLGHTALNIARHAADMLMDRELSPEVRGDIEQMIATHPEVHGVHDLRTRRSGMNIYISFDIELDPDMSLVAAHDIARQVETRILNKYPNAEIIIHKDPQGDIHDARHKVQGVHH